MKPTEESLNILRTISDKMYEKTFHHHSHILYDLPIKENGYYVEIGCYAGATACLMLQKKNINVVSIDLGYPIPPELVKQNVDMFNINKNHFNYIQGNSQTKVTKDKLKEITEHIDILFIDGDHSFDGVLKDFNLYQDMVSIGGWIVFDDYNDKTHSPEVKPAVDSIVKNISGYEIIGTFKNCFGARPNTLTDGNCFVIRKK